MYSASRAKPRRNLCYNTPQSSQAQPAQRVYLEITQNPQPHTPKDLSRHPQPQSSHLPMGRSEKGEAVSITTPHPRLQQPRPLTKYPQLEHSKTSPSRCLLTLQPSGLASSSPHEEPATTGEPSNHLPKNLQHPYPQHRGASLYSSHPQSKLSASLDSCSTKPYHNQKHSTPPVFSPNSHRHFASRTEKYRDGSDDAIGFWFQLRPRHGCAHRWGVQYRSPLVFCRPCRGRRARRSTRILCLRSTR